MMSPAEAMSLLFNRPEVELELDGGGILRVRLVSLDGELVRATAARLSVATDMTLVGRVVGPDGRPWAVNLVVDDASYHSHDLALVQMHPRSVGVDESRRLAERVPIGGMAWLEAVNCQDIVDRDRVDGSLEDLSRTGVAFTTSRLLRVGDRLIFHGRFFADSISGEVRVASVRPAHQAGHTVVGCRFLHVDTESIEKIDRVLSGGKGPAAERSSTLTLSQLRDLAVAGGGDEAPDDDDAAGGGWLRRIRKDR